jgi:hypothetical protein
LQHREVDPIRRSSSLILPRELDEPTFCNMTPQGSLSRRVGNARILGQGVARNLDRKGVRGDGRPNDGLISRGQSNGVMPISHSRSSDA